MPLTFCVAVLSFGVHPSCQIVLEVPVFLGLPYTLKCSGLGDLPLPQDAGFPLVAQMDLLFVSLDV